jgi:hypothetical protein
MYLIPRRPEFRLAAIAISSLQSSSKVETRRCRSKGLYLMRIDVNGTMDVMGTQMVVSVDTVLVNYVYTHSGEIHTSSGME